MSCTRPNRLGLLLGLVTLSASSLSGASPLSCETLRQSETIQAQTLVAPTSPNDSRPQPWVQPVLDRWVQRGFALNNQGLWLQSGDTLLGSHQGTTPLPAASITKVATTLVALHTLGWDHRFTTQISHTGSIEAGLLQGDLIITGGRDPFFVWEDAVAVGNALNQLGIQQVQGDLVIAGPFFMNFRPDPQTAGEILRLGLDGSRWPPEAETQFQSLSPETPRPQVQILGEVRLSPAAPIPAQPLIEHRSLPLIELLKRMNQYSNNIMADLMAETLGGASTVAQEAAQLTGVPQVEIQLINGSGLGLDNRISPRAACGLFLAVQRELTAADLTLGDTFQIVGQDPGVLQQRTFPPRVIAKSGTLNQVSGLAGILPTTQQGQICFGILNVSFDLEGARLLQGQLLRSLSDQWGSVSELPPELLPRLSPDQLSSQTQILP